ncbi:MAG: hypothetical protein ACFFB2_11415 [Promethearchaeota archaeon]
MKSDSEFNILIGSPQFIDINPLGKQEVFRGYEISNHIELQKEQPLSTKEMTNQKVDEY